MGRVARKILFAVGAVLLVLVVVVGSGFALLQTGPGKAWLAGTITRLASSADARVKIAGITGTVPFDMRVAQIRISDARGPWLTIEDVAIDIVPRDLFRRRLTIRELGASAITLARLPEAGPNAATKEPGNAGLPTLPRLPVEIDLRSLQVQRIAIDPAVLGEPVTASLVANATLSRGAIETALQLHRIDGHDGHVDLNIAARDGVLTVDAKVAEPGGLLLQRVLGRSERVPLTINVAGAGPLDGWSGTISAQAGDLASLDATVTIDGQAERHISTKGRLAAAQLLPPTLSPLMPQPLSFTGRVRLGERVVTLEQFTAETGAVTAEIAGIYEPEAERFAANATFSVPDLAVLTPLASAPLSGAAKIIVAADGKPDAPGAHVTLTGTDVRIAGSGADKVQASMELAADKGWRVTGRGQIDGVQIASFADKGLPDSIDWSVDAQSDRTLDRIALQDFTLHGGGVDLAASGNIESLAQQPAVSGTLRLNAPDLSVLRQAAGLPLAGAASIEAAVATDAGKITATVRGDARDLATGLPALDALLAPKLDIDAAFARADDGSIAVDALTLTTPQAKLSAHAALPAAADTISASATLDVPRLAPLGPPLGAALKGGATLIANVSGPIARPEVRAKLTGTGLVANSIGLDKLAADLTMNDATAPAGTLSATFATGTLAGKAAVQFARTAPNTLAIPKLSLNAGGTSIEGRLQVALDTSLVSGTITGNAADLAPWSALAGVPVAGSAEARVTLAAKGGQNADIDLTATNLARRGESAAAIGRVRVNARLTDLLGKPGGRADIEATAVRAPDLRIDRARMTARAARPGAFTVTADIDGAISPESQPGLLRLSGASEISLAGATRQVRLTRLSGKLAKYDIALAAPATLSLRGNDFGLDRLVLRIGKGEITASGSRAGERIALNVAVQRLPLGLMGVVAPDRAIDGELGAKLTLAGTLRQPNGTLDASLQSVRLTAGRSDLPPLSAAIDAKWSAARVDLTGQVDGPGGARIALAGFAPLLLDPQTLAISVPSNGALRLTARGTGQLESWAKVLPIGEDRIAGRFDLDLAVNGTVAAPQAGGRFTITDGHYVSFAAGTELRDLSLDITGNGERFVLNRLSAKDSQDGTLGAEGFFDLAATPGPALDLKATFARFLVARRDEATVTASGDLGLAGTISNAALVGQVRIDRAEIRIPDRLPPSIPRLDVVEIDSRSGSAGETPAPEAKESVLRLNVGVEIPARAFVRGRGLDSEWRGHVDVGGTASKPTVNGRLEVVRGDFALLGKKFVLSKGTIAFDGGPKIDPAIDITTEYKSADIVAQAIIGGSASAPSLTLTSQPSLPQDEVLARVLFGKSTGQITPGQGLELAQAAAELAGGGPGLLGRVRSVTGLDRLDVSSGTDSGKSNGVGPTVTGGKYINDRVFVGVQQGATSESTKTKVEVEVTPNISVESSVGVNSGAGVGVNWKWDY